jgi:hypothetical protein
MGRLPASRLLDAALAVAALWAVVGASRPAAALAIALAIVTLIPERGALRAEETTEAEAVPQPPKRRRPLPRVPRPGRPVVVELEPRRSGTRPRVTVEAVRGAAPVVPLRARDLPPARVAVRRPRWPRRIDADVIEAGWELATVAQGRQIDAAAVQLGLAAETPRGTAAVEPDALLLAATWEPGVRAA